MSAIRPTWIVTYAEGYDPGDRYPVLGYALGDERTAALQATREQLMQDRGIVTYKRGEECAEDAEGAFPVEGTHETAWVRNERCAICRHRPPTVDAVWDDRAVRVCGHCYEYETGEVAP